MSKIYDNRGVIRVTESEAIKELGETFVRTMEHIKNIAEANECFVLMHGTQMKNCLEIINDVKGLVHGSNNYTSTMSTFSYSELYNIGLVNGMLPDGFILLLVPKSCFNGFGYSGLWHSLVLNKEPLEERIDDTCTIDKIDSYSIPQEYIFGFIDLEKKQIVQNNRYDAKYRNKKLILDETTSGGLLLDVREENIKSYLGNNYDFNNRGRR